MAKVFIEETTLTAIGDAIREKEGTSELVPVVDMADRIKDIPSSGGGYDEGFEAGKKAEYDAFWDAFQNFGDKRRYNYAFLGNGWTNETFNPKYPIIVEGDASYMFDGCGLEDFDFVEKGITLDLSGTNSLTYAFRSCWGIKRLGTIDCSGCSDLNRLFYSCRVETIDNFVVHESLSYSSTFAYTGKLVNLTISGVIGKKGFDVSACTLLSKASIENIINHLSTTTSGLTVTLSTVAVNKAFETSEGANDGVESAEWKTLKETKSNWNIGYA